MQKQCRKNTGTQALGLIRPVGIGLLTAFSVTLALVAVFSLFFLIIEKIADSAIVPLALLSAAIGCFIGAYVCAAITHHSGLLFGACIGMASFVVIWIIGMFSSDCIFGTENVVKVVLMVGLGSIGGYLGCGRKPRRAR